MPLLGAGASIDVGGAGGLAGDDVHGKSLVAGDLGGGAAIFPGATSQGAPHRDLESVVPGQGVVVSGAGSELKSEPSAK